MEWPCSTYPKFPSIGGWGSIGLLITSSGATSLEFEALEVVPFASSIFLLVPKMVPATELGRGLELQLEKDLVKTPEIEPATVLVIAGDCSVKSMGSELSTLGFFCNGRPLDLVKYRLAGGFGGAGFTRGGFGLDGEGSEQILEVAPFAALFAVRRR
ncbi:hypothetical protein CK203_050096 [Vitis vinifera]|uniref:Uncharacterized protein n=1 Tax=Vitis vinifera TaxID=29760 RepID=A0A438H4Z6_VITVI|nr:hypothetical protein CK203_050096 [Vitis vinifera]